MAFNALHKSSCAINRKSYLANCTCGSTVTWLRQRMGELRAELNSANHDYNELLKERADYVAENERLLAAVGLALVLGDVESIKEVLQPWRKP